MPEKNEKPGDGTTYDYDYVVVGGGTAGSVIASRLTENPDVTVAVIEGGPSDIDRDDVLTLRRWLGLLGGDLDYGYTTTEQPRGNSHILHSRAKVLGGCSSHNTLISFKPLPGDWDEWAAAGAEGWDHTAMDPYFAKLRNNIVPVDEKDRNAIARDFVEAAQAATGVPRVEGFNKGPFKDGVGFFDLAYHPENNKRSSASVAYLHPHMEAGDRPNLTLLLETWAHRLEFDDSLTARGVRVRGRTARKRSYPPGARSSSAPAPSTPRLLLRTPASAPTQDLEKLGIPDCTTCTASARTCSTNPGVGHRLGRPTAPIPDQQRRCGQRRGLFVQRDPDAPGPT